MRFIKGHAAGNDFVLLPDPDGVIELTPERVISICDRRKGVGADGVLRVVRARAVPEAVEQSGTAEWFMDYRNADGSVAEMCGNGIRLYARYLVDAGLAPPGDMAIATRAGLKRLNVPPHGDVSVDMGVPEVGGTAPAVVGGRQYEGVRVELGNPHLACLISSPVSNVDLSRAPEVDRETFPRGVNVELVGLLASGHIEMRVHERGSGETHSCGTGAVAAVVAAARSIGQDRGDWRVDVLGGRLTVTLGAGTSYLTGPTVLVAEGEMYPPSAASCVA